MPDKLPRVFYVLVGGMVVYELVALSNKCPGDTISEIIWTATSRRPIVPFAFGVLMGHLFAPRVDTPTPAPASRAL